MRIYKVTYKSDNASITIKKCRMLLYNNYNLTNYQVKFLKKVKNGIIPTTKQKNYLIKLFKDKGI